MARGITRVTRGVTGVARVARVTRVTDWVTNGMADWMTDRTNGGESLRADTTGQLLDCILKLCNADV